MLPEPIELPEQRAVFFPELVGRGPPPPAPPLMPPPRPVARRAPPVAAPDDDDRSVASSFSATSAALGISSSPTPFARPADDGEDSSDDGGEDEGWFEGCDSDGDDTPPRADEDGGARTASSRFWGVSWQQRMKKWEAYYTDANGKKRGIGLFVDEEEAARAYNKAIRDAGLEGNRRTNAVDATGVLVPKRAAVVAPDPARAPTATTSKYWGVTWDKRERRWKAYYNDADGKNRHIGLFDTQEAAAHAVNAAIRRAGLGGKRRTNPVVDGRLVPKKRKANGHGPKSLRKRRRRLVGDSS